MMPVDIEAGVVGEPKRKKIVVPGEEMACLEIAIGILGVLLLVFPALTSIHGLTASVAGAGLALLVGLGLAIVGGFMGLNEARQRRAARLMAASGLVLTVTALILLAAAGDGLVSWDFPVGAIFLTLGLFADLAAWRFRKALPLL
jgi:hypothetical protein